MNTDKPTTFSVTRGSIAIVPLTQVEEASVQVDGSSILIIWDDQSDDIDSVRAEMKKALEIMAARDARPPHLHGGSPLFDPLEPEPLPTYSGPRPAGARPRDQTAPVRTRRERGTG